MIRDHALQDEFDHDTQQGLWTEPKPSLFDHAPPIEDFIETELKKPGKWVKRGIGEVYVTEESDCG